MENLINFKLFFSKLEKISCQVLDCFWTGDKLEYSYYFDISPQSVLVTSLMENSV